MNHSDSSLEDAERTLAGVPPKIGFNINRSQVVGAPARTQPVSSSPKSLNDFQLLLLALRTRGATFIYSLIIRSLGCSPRRRRGLRRIGSEILVTSSPSGPHMTVICSLKEEVMGGVQGDELGGRDMKSHRKREKAHIMSQK